jgi:crossover junction endodeoxyribonuclease RuvC
MTDFSASIPAFPARSPSSRWSNGVPALVDAVDMPAVGSGAKARVDILAAAQWMTKHAPSMAYVEREQALPGQGYSSGFSYGRAVGAIEATVALSRIPIFLVEASVWKRKLGLPGKDKEAARQRALQLFPAQHDLLARKNDHGRADAALTVVANLSTTKPAMASATAAIAAAVRP